MRILIKKYKSVEKILIEESGIDEMNPKKMIITGKR